LVIHASRHTSWSPFTKRTVKIALQHTHTHRNTLACVRTRYTCFRQFISMQISFHPYSGRVSWQTAFSLLYHLVDLDCTVRQNLAAKSTCRASSELIYLSMLSSRHFFLSLLNLYFVEEVASKFPVKNVCLQDPKRIAVF